MPYTIGSVQVIQTPLEPPEKDHHYDNGEPSVTVLRKGYTKDPDSAPFLVDTIFEKDVAFTLRDGVKIRADILRPADESITVPALVAWSPYGKGGRGALSPS
jgi:predicted acyl esterase